MVIAIIGVLVALLLPAVQAAREAARSSQCNNNIRQLAVAHQLYHDAQKALPTGGDKRGLLAYVPGWPALVMPYMEQGNRRRQIEALAPQALYKIMPSRAETPDLGQHTLFTDPIPTFICPSSMLGTQSPDAFVHANAVFATGQAGLHYRGNGGRSLREDLPVDEEFIKGTRGRDRWYSTSGVIYPNSAVRFGKISDGTSQTILLGENSSNGGRELQSTGWGSVLPWTWGYYFYGTDEEGWLTLDNKIMTYPIGYGGTYFANETPYSSDHAGDVAKFAFCDGSVRTLTSDTSLNILKSFATRAGGDLEGDNL